MTPQEYQNYKNRVLSKTTGANIHYVLCTLIAVEIFNKNMNNTNNPKEQKEYAQKLKNTLKEIRILTGVSP